MKRTLIVPAIVLAVSALTIPLLGCQPSGVGTPPPAPTPSPIPAPGITFYIDGDAKMDKEAYQAGEDVVIELSFENLTDEVFPLEPFPPQIEIMRRYPYDETVRTFSAGEDSRSLELGETASYTLTWDQRDDQGGSPCPTAITT